MFGSSSSSALLQLLRRRFFAAPSDRALTSMTQQTYENLEVIIVGDRCDDNTDVVVAGFCDRFKFFNLDTRGPYPRPGLNRWMVAGNNAANFALQRATGDLVTHLDEDDTYEPHRIETLVRELQRNEADLVFHPFYWQNDDHSWKILGNGDLELGQTGTGLILYHNWFAKIPWDVYAHFVLGNRDWNRLRKFKALGANLNYVDQILARHWKYPVREAFVASSALCRDHPAAFGCFLPPLRMSLSAPHAIKC